MKRSVLFAFALAVFVWSFFPLGGQAASSGSLVKASGPAVYYVWEGERYVFPNEQVFFSWYDDFGTVMTISDGELAQLPLGGNVTYRPGAKLVKITTDPKTYAVAPGGVLRWVTSEDVAESLYGADWNQKIHDVPDAFFLDYRQGASVADPEDFDYHAALDVAAISGDMQARAEPAGNDDETEEEPRIEFRAQTSGAWSDPATWGGTLPGADAEVFVPLDLEVVYDLTESPNFRRLDIDGALIFETDAHTELAARLIEVGGRLIVGTAEEPVPPERSAAIHLTGASSFAASDDGLRVDGQLEMHGAEPDVSWTRLSETASAGSAELSLTEEVAWQEGNEIVIAPGGHDPEDAEMRTILSVDGNVITLTAPLDHDHAVSDLSAPEVGLLSRNVEVRGAGEGRGSYVALRGRAQARIAGAGFHGLGRTGVAGQYALYYDGLGPAADSYLRNSVVTNSGNRCAVLRQTRDMTVSGLVAYDMRGHCLSTAEGSETDLHWTENLVILTRAGSEATGDPVPAAFYLRNPSAVLEDNAAVASAGHGYWYDLPKEAVRSDGALQRPRETSLGGFHDNSARLNGGDGLHVDGSRPGSDPEEINYSPLETAVFSGLRASVNEGYGFWMRGSNLEVRNAVLSENTIGGSFAAFAATFRNSLVVGGERGRYGFTFQDGPVSVTDVTFRDFTSTEDRPASAFSFHTPNPRVPDPRNQYQNVVFEDAEIWHVPEPQQTGDYLSLALDADAGETIAAREPFLNVGCETEEGSHVMICPARYGQLLAVFRGASGSEEARFIRLPDEAAFTLFPGEAFDGEYAWVPLAEQTVYRVDGPNVRHLTFDWTGVSSPVTLRVSAPENAEVRFDGTTAAPKPWTDIGPGEYGYDAAAAEIVLELGGQMSADISW